MTSAVKKAVSREFRVAVKQAKALQRERRRLWKRIDKWYRCDPRRN